VGKSPKPVDPSFQAMAEVLSLGMSYQLATSPDGSGRRFLYVSDSCLALNGVTAPAVMADARTFYDLVIPEHRALTAEATTRAILAHQPLMVEYAIRKPNGEMGWRRATSAPRPDLTQDGWSIWDGLQVDITEQKQSELELEAQRQRLDLAVEASGLGLWEYHVRDERSVWSGRTKALYGLPPEAEIGFDTWFGTLVHPETRPTWKRPMWRPWSGWTGPSRWNTGRSRRTARCAGCWPTDACCVTQAGPIKVLGTVLDITERQEAEERRRLVANELAHRSKNGLAMIMAIIQQSARTAETVKDYEARPISRIGAMARSQDLVTGAVGPLTLGDLFKSALDPFDTARFRIAPELVGCNVNADVALMVALLIHELGTNATKYGALSTPPGRIELASAPAAAGMVAVIWREAAGPPVTPPAQTGFGTRLIAAALRTYGGSARAQFPASGLEARMEFPIQNA
jgi:two-component sensor histidine kinase